MNKDVKFIGFLSGFLFFLLIYPAWVAGEAGGFSFDFVYTGEVTTNYRGGIETGSEYLGNVDITAELDTGKVGLWCNGTFFIYMLGNHGGNPAEERVGDLQTVSNIETTDYTRLYEAWYEHGFSDGRFSVLLGQHDLNSEFNVTEYGGLFINSSFGIEPDISANAPVSIFSVAAPALRVKWEPGDSFNFLAAVYDGDPGAADVNKDGMDWRVSEKEGAMTIYEMAYISGDMEDSGSMPGSYKLGLWYHTADFEDVKDTDINGDPVKQSGNYGVYLLVDQMIFPAQGGRGLGAFLQIGAAPADRNLVDFYVGGGLHYHGLFPGRPDDTIGLAAAHASISEKQRDSSGQESSETTVELTYRLELAPWFAIQPDFQYVINPGADPSLDDAVVSIVRFEAGF